MTPDILAAGKRWTSPYSRQIDWCKHMTPIEYDMWQSIRVQGFFPLYPQYPVGKYFTDFGNPYFKVAVECDGKEFHLDKERDKRRDDDFKSLGWTVYRVPGSACYKVVILEDFREDDDDEYYAKLKEYFLETTCGLVRSLALKYEIVEPRQNELYLMEECLNKWRS